MRLGVCSAYDRAGLFAKHFDESAPRPESPFEPRVAALSTERSHAARIEHDVRIDGRSLDHANLEPLRLMAVRRVYEGEDPGSWTRAIVAPLIERSFDIALWRQQTYPAPDQKPAGRIEQRPADVRDDPRLVRSGFQAPYVTCIGDCRTTVFLRTTAMARDHPFGNLEHDPFH